MTKAVALVALHICRRAGEVAPDGRIIRPADIEVKPPGSIVDLDKAQYETFEAAGHVRAPTEDELTLDKASRGRRRDAQGSASEDPPAEEPQQP